VREAFEQERGSLLGLPDNPFPTEDCLDVSVGKTPYLRYDLNDYSVPHTYVRRTVRVMATRTVVRVLADGEDIARHPRSYGKGEQVEDPAHIEALVDAKRQARQHRGQDRLAHCAPSSQALLQQAARRGSPLKRVVSQLLQLLEDYGAAELEQAITEALDNDVPHPNAVRQVLERRREARHQPPPLIPALPEKARDIAVRPASLADYDRIDSIDSRDEQIDGPEASETHHGDKD
jgi:hypothetical protein